jgi:hypothetical protein
MAQQDTAGGSVPSIAQLANYSVTLPGFEAITQSLYDTQVYAAAGQPVLAFFAAPVGAARNFSLTNMQIAGSLPANNAFLIMSIELRFQPVTPTVAAAMPAAFGAQAVATLINDVYIFNRSGNLLLNIGNKTYLQEAPLGRFPSKTYLSGFAGLADVSTTGGNLQSRVAYMHADGRPYILKAPLLLEPSQAFNLTLNWPEGNQAITSPATVVCVLDGIFYRKSQ